MKTTQAIERNKITHTILIMSFKLLETIIPVAILLKSNQLIGIITKIEIAYLNITNKTFQFGFESITQ